MSEAVLGEPRLAPKLTPPVFCFVSATEVIPEDPKDESWYAGIWYAPEGPGVGEVHRVCADDAKTATSGIHAIVHRPYALVASDSASTFGWQVRDYQARATRKLLAIESKLIENELWNATVETANVKIAGPHATVVGGAGAPAPYRSIKWLEQALADLDSGQRYMIHMRPKVFEAIQAEAPQMLQRDPTQNRWLTALDNIVVPGRGYSGTGPAGQAVGATEWIYATPMIRLRKGEVFTNPQTIAEANKRDRNLVTFYAERVVGTDWDTSVTHLALEVTP